MGIDQEKTPSLAMLEGRVPPNFLFQMGPTCLNWDYGNKLPITFLFSMFFGGQPSYLSREELLEEIKGSLKHTRTYTEYWQTRIDKYNACAAVNNQKSVEVEEMIRLLVTDIPGTAEVDSIALELRSLGEEDGTNIDLVERAARLTVKAYSFVRGEEEARKILAYIGLSESPNLI